MSNFKSKPTAKLEERDLSKSRVMSQGFYNREIRLSNKNHKPLKVNLKNDSPEKIEAEIARALEVGCNFDKIEALKADYAVMNLLLDKQRGEAMIELADSTQDIVKQSDGSLLKESDLASIDYSLARCEKPEEIAARFGVDITVIQQRALNEEQAIIDLRRKLNAELEDSTIGIVHDFNRLQELQDTLELIKAHITEIESLRIRTDITEEQRFQKMAALPNIISLITSKEKIIASASKEMKQRRELTSGQATQFELTEAEKEKFQELHKVMPVLELVVGRASADNGWDTAYMLHNLNKSIYKDFRKGEFGEEKEIKKLKDMTLPYPSTQPVNIEEVVSKSEGREEDLKLMRDRDSDILPEALSEKDKKKQELLDKIRRKQEGNGGE